MRQALTDARQSADACDNMHVPRAVASVGIECDARQQMQPMLRSAYAVNESKTKSNRGSKKMPGIRHNRGIARTSCRRRACERVSSCCYAARGLVSVARWFSRTYATGGLVGNRLGVAVRHPHIHTHLNKPMSQHLTKPLYT